MEELYGELEKILNQTQHLEQLFDEIQETSRWSNDENLNDLSYRFEDEVREWKVNLEDAMITIDTMEG